MFVYLCFILFTMRLRLYIILNILVVEEWKFFNLQFLFNFYKIYTLPKNNFLVKGNLKFKKYIALALGTGYHTS